MPIVRKLINLRTSKAIILPKSWLDLSEQEAGRKIVAVAVEVNKKLRITPIFKQPDFCGSSVTSKGDSNDRKTSCDKA